MHGIKRMVHQLKKLESWQDGCFMCRNLEAMVQSMKDTEKMVIWKQIHTNPS